MTRVATFLTSAVLLLASCGSAGDGNDQTPDGAADEFVSFCDDHGHRVYLTEDDRQATPGIFVLPNDCAEDRR